MSEITFSSESGAQLTIGHTGSTPVIELSINRPEDITARDQQFEELNTLPNRLRDDHERITLSSLQVNRALRVHLQYTLDADLLHFMAVMAATFNRWSGLILRGVVEILRGLGFGNDAINCFNTAVQPFATTMGVRYIA